MNYRLKQLKRFRKWSWALLLLLVVLAVSGCQNLSFYSQAIKGQYQILANRQSIHSLVANEQTPAELKAKLEKVEQMRAYARQELKLPVDGHYEKYVDVHRRFVVWNVEAAKEFSLEPKSWWYPLLGSLEYRGYFSERGAQKYAASLRKKGFDVYVGGVEAYSTLGWFHDPILSTFVSNPEPDLAETIFHELGHQRVFARSDTDFNEAFATIVGQEGARRWLQSKGDTKQYTEYLEQIRRNNQFVHLVMASRTVLAALYQDELTESGRIKGSRQKLEVAPEQLRQKKEAILDRMRKDYAQLKSEWGGNQDYDGWFAGTISNAKLNSVAAYYDLLPGFERLLALNGGDLEKFYQGADELAKKTKGARHERLRALCQEQVQSGNQRPPIEPERTTTNDEGNLLPLPGHGR